MVKKKNKVSQDDKEFFNTDYSTIPEQIKKIIEPEPEIIEKTRKVVYDGSQYLIRFPKEISETMKITKDDKVKFTLKILPNERGEKTLKIEYLQENR
ncbi:MAG: hypothetical protein JXC85_06240 [Candidatus Aenigmarchaeota archaeon]|nr:hypothetical protein [Candidatus Aenigmarchaeota archaeon]